MANYVRSSTNMPKDFSDSQSSRHYANCYCYPRRLLLPAALVPEQAEKKRQDGRDGEQKLTEQVAALKYRIAKNENQLLGMALTDIRLHKKEIKTIRTKTEP